ncbi:Protein of unknown function [Gryllus bimaculatus]|nr:Protein of unknown function [Gryllus bimaculatus]
MHRISEKPGQSHTNGGRGQRKSPDMIVCQTNITTSRFLNLFYVSIFSMDVDVFRKLGTNLQIRSI